MLLCFTGIGLLLNGASDHKNSGKTRTKETKAARRTFILNTAFNPERPDELHLSKIPKFEDDDIKLLPNDGTIVQLDLSGPRYAANADVVHLAADQLSERGFEYVSKLTNLKGIKLHSASVSQQAMDNLVKLTDVTDFDARNTTFTDLKTISRWKKLKYAVFSFFTPADILTLKQLPLTFISLADSQIDAPMIEALLSLKQLKVLALYGCQRLDGSSLRKLNLLPQLEEVTIDNTPIVANDVPISLATLKRVTRLSLKSDDLTDDHLKQISTMSWLKSLFIGSNPKVSAVGLGYLSKLRSLERLDVGTCTGLTPKDVENFKLTPNMVRSNVEIIMNFDRQISRPPDE